MSMVIPERTDGKYEPYPEYNDPGIECIGEIPAHWEIKRLRFLSKINPSKTEIKDWSPDLEVTFLPMEDVGCGNLNIEQTRELNSVSEGYTYFRDGDVLVAKITPCFENGKGAISKGLLNGIGFGTTELHIIRPAPDLNRRFLMYITISHAFRNIGESEMYGAAGQKRVPDKFIRDFACPYPSSKEQQMIVDFLDRETSRIDELISRKQRLIELLQEQRTALITHTITKGLNPDAPMKDSGVEWLGQIPYGWNVRKLKYVGQAIIGLTFQPSDVVDESQGILVLRASNIQNSHVSMQDNVYVKTQIPRNLITRTGDILICSRSGSRDLIGKSAKITPDAAGMTFGAFMTVFRSKMCDYLYYVFNSQLFNCELGAFQTTTINQLTINILNNFKVPLPPLEEQQVIADFLDSETARIDGLISKINQAIEKLQEYRSALITAAVTGKIDVRKEAT